MPYSVTMTRDNFIAEVTINRPERKNAADLEVFERLAMFGEQLKHERDLRAVILTGAGGNFCSGIDTALFTDNPDPASLVDRMFTVPAGETANFFQKPCMVWQELEVPVIAALQGVTYGAGLQIALGADIRLASPDVRMSVMEIKWGLIPDMGLSTTLPRLLRSDQAKELIFTGRIVEALEALELGLVTRLCRNPIEEARALATEIALKNPDAIKGDKRLINETWYATQAESLRLEAELQAKVFGQPNQVEAMMAAVQKRRPRFT